MGMDLIVHIVKGPVKLPRNKRAAAAELLEQAQHAARAWLAYYETATVAEQVAWDVSEITKQLLEFVTPEDDHDLDTCTYSVERVAALDTVAWLNKLYENWPNLGRDTCWRRYNQQLVVVAGEGSWGDSPSGVGYDTISTIFLFVGLAELLGIR